MRVAVGEHMRPVMAGDDASLAAGIAGQTGVPGRVDIARPHPVPHREERRSLRFPREGRAECQHVVGTLDRQTGVRGGAPEGAPGAAWPSASSVALTKPSRSDSASSMASHFS